VVRNFKDVKAQFNTYIYVDYPCKIAKELAEQFLRYEAIKESYFITDHVTTNSPLSLQALMKI